MDPCMNHSLPNRFFWKVTIPICNHYWHCSQDRTVGGCGHWHPHCPYCPCPACCLPVPAHPYLLSVLPHPSPLPATTTYHHHTSYFYSAPMYIYHHSSFHHYRLPAPCLPMGQDGMTPNDGSSDDRSDGQSIRWRRGGGLLFLLALSLSVLSFLPCLLPSFSSLPSFPCLFTCMTSYLCFFFFLSSAGRHGKGIQSP